MFRKIEEKIVATTYLHWLISGLSVNGQNVSYKFYESDCAKLFGEYYTFPHLIIKKYYVRDKVFHRLRLSLTQLH